MPIDLALEAVSGSRTSGDDSTGKLPLEPVEAGLSGDRMRNMITPALTKVNTCRVPKEIVLARASKSMKHATSAVKNPVMMVPTVGTPVCGCIFA